MLKCSQKCRVALGVTAGIIGIADTLWLLLYQSGINLGTVLPGVAGVFLLSIAFYKANNNEPIIKNHKLKQFIISLSLLWIISFAAVVSLLIIAGQSESEQKADYLLILGSGLRGEQVSLTLKKRLDKGIEYLIKHPDMKVIVSGGKGLGESITEAEAMRRYLINNNIDNQRIIKEEQATSTMENFKYTKALLLNIEDSGNIRLMIVTNDFHMLRSKMLAERNGFEAYGISSRTPYQVIVNTYTREYFALIKSFLFDR